LKSADSTPVIFIISSKPRFQRCGYCVSNAEIVGQVSRRDDATQQHLEPIDAKIIAGS
jgi:hypothetical protein